jgi:hypothetical protein
VVPLHVVRQELLEDRAQAQGEEVDADAAASAGGLGTARAPERPPVHEEGAGRFDTYIHPKGLTAAEADYVKRLWDTMPGYTCWMDAFYRVLHGKTEAQS